LNNRLYMYAHYKPEELARRLEPPSIEGVEFDVDALARAIVQKGKEQLEELRSLASEISAREAERVKRSVTESGHSKSKVDIMIKYPFERGTALVKEATVKFTDKGNNPAEREIYRFLMDDVIEDCARRDTDVDFRRLVVNVMAVRPV